MALPGKPGGNPGNPGQPPISAVTDGKPGETRDSHLFLGKPGTATYFWGKPGKPGTATYFCGDGWERGRLGGGDGMSGRVERHGVEDMPARGQEKGPCVEGSGDAPRGRGCRALGCGRRLCAERRLPVRGSFSGAGCRRRAVSLRIPECRGCRQRHGVTRFRGMSRGGRLGQEGLGPVGASRGFVGLRTVGTSADSSSGFGGRATGYCLRATAYGPRGGWGHPDDSSASVPLALRRTHPRALGDGLRATGYGLLPTDPGAGGGIPTIRPPSSTLVPPALRRTSAFAKPSADRSADSSSGFGGKHLRRAQGKLVRASGRRGCCRGW